MGVSIHQHLGPYLRLKAPFKPVEYKIHTCTNAQCKMHKRKLSIQDNFCSKCGSQNKEQIFISHEPISPPFEELPRLSQVFTPNHTVIDGFIYLLPADNKSHFHIAPRDHSFLEHEIKTDLPTKEIEWLKEEFKDEINQLKQWCNGELPTVEWGLISYQN
jgi:hypothetical protein